MSVDSYKKLINSVEDIPTPKIATEIFSRVNQRINRRRLVAFRYKFLCYVMCLLAACLIFKPAFNIAMESATHSGLFDYLSLFAYGGTQTFFVWKELMLSVIESLPTAEISALLAVLLVFVYSLRHVVSASKELSIYEQPFVLRRVHINRS